MNNTDYVSLETAKLLKEVRYNKKCNAYYVNIVTINSKLNIQFRYGDSCNMRSSPRISATTLYDSQKWLRDVHKIHIEISIENYTDAHIWQYAIFKIYEDCTHEEAFDGEFKTYELALDAAIKDACKLIINGEN